MASYNADLEKHFESMWPGRGRNAASEELQQSVEQRFWEKYGMPWRYNQAVGWIRVYILGSQIRGEFWFSNAGRLTRNPVHRQIRLMGKAFELHIYPTEASDKIAAQIRSDIIGSVKNWRPRRLFVDMECFDNLAKHVDWRALIHGVRQT